MLLLWIPFHSMKGADADLSSTVLAALEHLRRNGRSTHLHSFKAKLSGLFIAAWLRGWTIAGGAAGHSLLQHFNLFLCFWLVGWALGDLAVSYAILYMLEGREVILANSETLRDRKSTR